MAVAKSFQELKVYQLARQGAQRIFALTREFPREERYSLTDQIRRSSRAVKAMIAEACAKRRYKASFISKIDDALGESNETQSWLEDSLDCDYISPTEYEELNNLYCSIGAMLARMIDRAEDFCKYPAATDYRFRDSDGEEQSYDWIDTFESEFFEQSPPRTTNHQSPITNHYQSPWTPLRF